MEKFCHIDCFKDIAQFVKENSCDASWFDNSVATTAIVCVTLIIIILIVCSCLKGYYKQRDKDSEIKILTDRIAKLENSGKVTESKKEKSSSEKEREYFLNFCYEMIRSENDLEDENNRIVKSECWKYLRDTFVEDGKIKDIPQDMTDTRNHEG